MPNKLYLCSLCHYATRKQSTFSMHMIMKHKPEKPHVCTECGQTFSVRTQLQQHMKNHHNDSVIPCLEPYCTCTFKTDAGHYTHYVRNHMNIKDLICPIDMEEANIKNERKRLMRCLYCGKVGLQSAMYYHLSVCHPSSPFVTEKSTEIREIKRRRKNYYLENLNNLDQLEDLDDIDESSIYCLACESSETSDQGNIKDDSSTETSIGVICPEGAYVEIHEPVENIDSDIDTDIDSVESLDVLLQNLV